MAALVDLTKLQMTGGCRRGSDLTVMVKDDDADELVSYPNDGSELWSSG
jgi:hypothetical protein